jgi:hypothetical protein
MSFNKNVNHVVELDLSGCANVFASSPCLATNALGYECYNTKATCQDEDNFTLATRTIKLSESNNSLIDGAIPCIIDKGIDFAPTEINPKEGLDYLGKVKIKVSDFAHNDIGQDPYFSTRPDIATDQGTFWGKLLARNPHYYGRPLFVKQYIDGVLSDTYQFVIETITPPDSKGLVTITAKDPLFLAGGKGSLAPKAPLSELSADISETDSIIPLVSTNFYGYPGAIRIGSEIITYTGSYGNDLNGTVTRGAWGTKAAEHKAGDKAQQCIVFENEPLIDAVRTLLDIYTPINGAFIPYAKWQAEQSDWLSVYTLTNIISEPTEVLELLSQIQRETGVVIWWGQRDQEINLKASVPRTQNQQVSTLTDSTHLMAPIEIKSEDEKRISQVWMYYGIEDYTSGNNATNFRNLEIRADAESEDASEYGTESIEVIYCRWITGVAQAGQVASRKLARYRNPPKTISFSLDDKDSALRTGDHFYLQTAFIQSKTGAPLPVEMQMLSMRYFPRSLSHRCKAQSFNYLLNEIYGYIAPDATPDYTSATEIQKTTLGFICGDDGKMSDGEEGYLII